MYGATETFQQDPHWRDYILFYEYFHGDNGAGIGASHQTGWTGLVSGLMCMRGTPEEFLNDELSLFERMSESQRAATAVGAAG